TAGQIARMRALFATGGSRASLLTSTGCSSGSTACGTPASLSSSSITATTATVSWGAVTGATAYNLRYKLTSSGTWTTVNNLTSTSTNLTGLTASSTYEFQVQAVCGSTSGSFSSSATFTTTASSSTCAEPTSLMASSITSNSAVLTWGAVSGAIRYNVRWKLASATSWNVVAVTTNSYSLTGLTASTQYQFAVQTVCSSTLSSNYSSTASFTTSSSVSCGTPTGLTISSITATTATISWTAVTGATSYNVRIKASTSSTWTTLTSTSTSMGVTNLQASTTYNVQVQAVCGSTSSNYSTQVNFTTAASGSCTDSYEPNNSQSAAKAITTGTTITAKICSATDVDWYSFANTSTSQNIKVTLTNLPADYDLELYNASGTMLYYSNNGGTTSESIIYNNAPVATYYVKVYGYNGAFSTTSNYSLLASRSSTAFSRMSENLVEETSSELPLFHLYPNPSRDVATIEYLGTSSNVQVQVLDLMGRIVLQGQLSAESSKLSLNLEQLGTGFYLVQVQDENSKSTQKLQVIR
ncbi:MAG: fibronectin type III domain-containing protein, partial [Bacteroidia bacterium]|nr:fibronectin type III domain-containing protein [Bacteroidia bacterium]